ncbi:type ISP restriction/modification enzyme [Rhodoferax sp.]|uniref:type ISP restriction/modification enzyme n=1 Tax=Rhodoferax sp. TaxID=50421 RepID=UPI0026152CC8|nr:type ISP restriction/modification enzyme [Rhodoferax sp.]MDD2810233.1 N-6 DNA methylase [Rhodoferax sp.]
MSLLLINHYLRQLDLIKKVSGSNRETIVREAFKDLLKNWGKQHELVFIAEYGMKTASKTLISVDGALLHELRMPLGYWEAKDANDNLDAEIVKKFKKGYPQDNIIFSDDAVAVLWQNRAEVLRCDMTDTTALAHLLEVFFSFERPEIAGFRTAVEQFKTDLPAVLQALRHMIDAAHVANPSFRQSEEKFLRHAQEAINPILTEADVREMLIQHILTEEIFAKVFDDSDFHQHNNVARELYALEGAFFTGALKKQTLKGLETYYAAIRAAAAQISSHSEKQTFLKIIYENFYKVYNTKAADRLGVVYTPNEIVRFMIDGADWLCEQHFGKNLIDPEVDILDPATGTGTFICELLEHFRGQPQKLAHKYRHELHANEVAILPYYVANLNIESTYAAITGQYEEFQSLCFVDTLDNVGLHTAAKGTTVELFGSVSEENVARIKRQNSKRISVVIGNPPYNANQANENDNNKNRTYPHIDARIKQTYIAQSTAQKTKLYDMYARFFRWASDRLNQNGIIAFVSNSSFIDSRTFDGFRKVLTQEFNEIWVVDLKGNARTSGERRRQEGGNIFHNQIRVGVAIWFCVKKQGARGCKIMYESVPDYEKADEKLSYVSSKPLWEHHFDHIKPDEKNNWINLTHNDFDTLLPLASKETKAAKTNRDVKAIFRKFSLGVVTARDEWVYDVDPKQVERKVKCLIDAYNLQLRGLKGTLRSRKGLENRLTNNIKWSRAVKNDLSKSVTYKFVADYVCSSLYRPYVERKLYFSKQLNEMQYLLREIFGPGQGSQAICISGVPAAKPFQTLAVNSIPCYDMLEKTQTLPLYRYELGQRVDNITDWALKQFTAHYRTAQSPAPTEPPAQGRQTRGKAPQKITKEAIFHYCYAVLHDPIYREKYAQNLKRDFPRMPFYPDFWQWAAWGENLMALHIGFENAAPFALQRIDIPDEKSRAAGLPPKTLLRADPTAGSIAIDTETTLRGIPPEAWAYKLGNRSALDWVLDQYKEKKPKDPTLREQFDTYRFADHKENVINLLMRVTTVSLDTVHCTTAMQQTSR